MINQAIPASQGKREYNADSPIGKQIMGILLLIEGIENMAAELEHRTSAYSLPLAEIQVEGESEASRMSALESTLFQARKRLERAASKIQMTIRGLQI